MNLMAVAMEHHQCTQINTSTISHQNVHIRRGGRRDPGEGAWPGDELTCGRGGRRDPGEGAADGGRDGRRARQTAREMAAARKIAAA